MKIGVSVRSRIEGQRCIEELEALAGEHEAQIEIITYKNTEQLIFDLEAKRRYLDIIYIGVSGDKQDSFYAVQLIRKTGYTGQLILLSDSTIYAVSGYEEGALAYLIEHKTSRKDFCDTFQRAVKRALRHEQETIRVTNNKECLHITVKDIYYVEMLNRELHVFLASGKISCRTPISQMELKLQEKGFLRVHRSFIINPVYANSISRKEIIMKDERVIPVGPNYRKVVYEIFGGQKESTESQKFKVPKEFEKLKKINKYEEHRETLEKYVERSMVYAGLAIIMESYGMWRGN